MLEINQKAPTFSCLNQDNKTIRLSDFSGKKTVVLYFYPKDDTPGCTIQANQFSELISEFNKINVEVIGISKDDCQSHLDFIKKFDLKINLLSDTNGTLCDSYKVWQEKEKNGVKKMGIVRSTFIINKDGDIKDVMYHVSAEGHAKSILNRLKN